MLDLQLKFIHGVRYELKFLFGIWISSCFSCICQKHSILSVKNLYLFQKSAVYVCVGLFLDSQMCFVDLFLCFDANTTLS